MTVRRLKTYTAETGFVYEYYFVGARAALPHDPEAPAIEYVFDVSSDRKLTFAVSVFLRDEAVRQWQQVHGRELADPERYAAAKLRLLRALDAIEDMTHSGRRLAIPYAELDELLAGLDV